MAQYDGRIRISTEIEVKQGEKELKTLESSIEKTADKIASLRSKMDSLKDTKIPTQEYQEISAQIEKAEQRFDKLLEKQKEMQREGKDNGVAWQRLNDQIADTDKEIALARGELQDLVDTGKAFTLGTDTQEYAEMSAQMQQLNQQMQSDTERQAELQSQITEGEEHLAQIRENAVVGNRHIIETLERIKQLEQEIADLKEAGVTEGYSDYDNRIQEISSLKQEVKDYKNGIDQIKGKYKELGDTAKKSLEKMINTQKRSIGVLGSFGKQLKSIVAATFIFNTIRKAFNSLIKGIKEGFENLYEGNKKLKSSVDNLKASALTLKNSLATAFAPLVETAIPYIQRFVEWLTKAVNLVGQFIAALMGRKTYTKAVKQTAKASEDAAKATKKEADAMEEAQEAAEGYLSPLDEINKYREEEIKSPNVKKEDEIEEPELGVENMFEEIPIDSRILDFLQKLKDLLKPAIDYAKKLKDIFMQGFFDGLGDWEYRWQSIKDSLASIKNSLIDIFTDPVVLAAVDKWAQSVAYMLGSLAGSMASIGLTIATNLLGGIAKYLEQNKDRIKEYLISMFDIWAEINYLFADLFQSIAYVFEAFASEEGQQLTANIIGIFTDAFMGMTELASKLFRDIAQIIIKPFVDNKEAFRTALEGFLGVLAEVTGTIKQGIDNTFAKLNEVYDTHFKPFFDSVANGLSDLVGKFMEFWNRNVQPILDQMAADFDALWTAHIQPLLNNAAVFLGKVADLLKALWENILQPLIAWIIENILPKILPIIQAIWDMLVNFVSYIADAVSGIITILGGIIDFLTGVFTGDWELAFQGLQDIVGGFIDTVMALIEGFATLISDAVKGIFEFIKSLLSAFVEAIKSLIETFFNWINENVVNKGNEIKQSFENFLAGVKEKWDNGWNVLKEKVQSIVDGIKETIQSAFDWIAEKISAIGEKLSSIGSKAKSLFSGGSSFFSGGLFGGSSFSASTYSISSPAMAALSSTDNIPRLATGAVIPANKKFLAVLGDQKHGTNVEAPLDTIKQAQRESILEVLSELGLTGNRTNNNPQTIIIKQYLDGKQVAESVIKEGKMQQMATGSNMFMLGTT